MSTTIVPITSPVSTLIPAGQIAFTNSLPAPLEDEKYFSFESWRYEDPFDADKWFIWFFLYHNKKRKKPLSEKSLKAYIEDIEQMLRYFYRINCPFRDVGYGQLDGYEKTVKHDYAQNSARRKLTVLSSLLRYGAKNRFFERDMTDYIQIPEKKNTRQERKLNREQIAALLKEINNKEHLYFLFRTLLFTGLRVSELVSIRWHDIQVNPMGTYLLRVVGKGEKIRFVPLDSDLMLDLFKLRSNQGNSIRIGDGDEYLFVSKNGRPLSDRGVREMVKRAAKRAKINVTLSPHWFRHTFATFALLGGAPIDQVQKDLGHSDLRTTQEYLHDLTEETREGAGSFVNRALKEAT
jgi:integrase/recombinase XerD